MRSALDVIPTAPQPSCVEERRCYKHSASSDPVFVFLIMSKRVAPIVGLIADQNVLALPVGAGRRIGSGRILERRNNYSGDANQAMIGVAHTYRAYAPKANVAVRGAEGRQ